MVTDQLIVKLDSIVLDASETASIESHVARFMKIVGFEFVDTGFFTKTEFKSLLLVLQMKEDPPGELPLLEELANGRLRVSISPDVRVYRTAGDAYISNRILEALVWIAERFGLEHKSLSFRLFESNRDMSGGVTRPADAGNQADDEPLVELQICMRLSDDGFGSADEAQFYLGEFSDRIESLLSETTDGCLEGNDFGAGEFCLYCMGDKPGVMLDACRAYLKEVSTSAADYIVLKELDGETTIPIGSL